MLGNQPQLEILGKGPRHMLPGYPRSSQDQTTPSERRTHLALRNLNEMTTLVPKIQKPTRV